jgi:CO/xanthine dehydrogenase Mo-binding subunit
MIACMICRCWTPLAPVMAAVANAVHNAPGKRLYSLPMSPPKVVEVLEG